MADTTVDATTSGDIDHRNGLWGPYWIDESIAVIIYINSDNDIEFARTTNKGASWTLTQIKSGTAACVAVWFDQETPGDSGTLLHCAWVESSLEDIFYQTVDISDGSLGTERTVATPPINASSSGFDLSIVITKSLNGNLFLGYHMTDAGDTEEALDFLKSTDGGANWTSKAALYETQLTFPDHALLFPANTGDENDVCALYWDTSANTIIIKMYDDSANAGAGAWTSTNIDTDAVEDITHINMDGAIRHSDKHLLMAFHSNDDTAGDDLRLYDITVDSIASPTVTAKAAVFTDQGESAQVGMMINQQNNDVYLAYLKGGTWTGLVDVVFHLSDDDLATWETESAYSEGAPDDLRRVMGGRTVGDSGGRWQPVWFDDDDKIIFVNEVNDVEIAAVTGANAPTGHLLGPLYGPLGGPIAA